jgi:hypothetical protein
MFAANTYDIRLATEHDDASLSRLAERDSARPLQGQALIGHIVASQSPQSRSLTFGSSPTQCVALTISWPACAYGRSRCAPITRRHRCARACSPPLRYRPLRLAWVEPTDVNARVTGSHSQAACSPTGADCRLKQHVDSSEWRIIGATARSPRPPRVRNMIGTPRGAAADAISDRSLAARQTASPSTRLESRPESVSRGCCRHTSDRDQEPLRKGNLHRHASGKVGGKELAEQFVELRE